MTKVGRTLSYINTSERKKASLEASTEKMKPSKSVFFNGGGGGEYLLKSVWNKAFEFRKDLNGNEYLFGKLPLVLQYGLTMYADNGADIPTLAEGLPFDQRTIWFNAETGQIEVIGGTGGGEGGVSNFWDLSGIPSWITSTKPIYNYSEIKNTPDLSVFVTGTALNNTLADYTTLSYLTGELKKYVTIMGDQEIVGVKNFVNGLKIGGLPITKKQDDVVYLDANLVVRGGITMYAENEVDIPSILDSLPIASNTALGIASFDSTYFSVDSNGMVSLTSVPSSGASSLGELLNVDASIDATATVDRVLYQPAGSATWTWKELISSGAVGDYLPLSGGRLYGNLGINIDRSAHGLHVKGSVGIGQNTSGTATIDAFGSMAFFGCDAVTNGTFTSQSGAFIAVNGTTGYIAVGHTEPLYKLDIASSTNQIVRVISVGNQEASIRYTNNSWKSWVAGIGAGLAGDAFGIWSETLGYSPLLCYNNGCVVINRSTMIGEAAIGFNREIATGGRFDTSYYGFQIHVDRTENALWFGREHTSWGLLMKLFSDGSLLTYGGITMYSDIRKKTKLQDVELSLSQIANAPLIQHYYNSDDSQTTHVGSIAQYWANLNDWFCKLDNEGYYTMEIQNCALASAISIARELEKYETKTDKTIRKMKQRIAELEDEVERLKNN